ncbi:hypothetical protein [Geothrix edaphica]|uniref:Uncharacterized protein n=1 Tax=Geothrix edaphica TaxID=2927976 RepID=A0ABQ5PXQ3_9BACT|nr:hypothetical protein [Geothrix edaphica]GLH67167.1 hypothetical protein GETHED_15310 [Geothrix edaphica]
MRTNSSKYILLIIFTSMSLLFLGCKSIYKTYDRSVSDAELFTQRLNEVFPSDIAVFIDRYRICQHWLGEDAYDEERGKDIERGITENCNGLKELESQIQIKYKTNEPLLMKMRQAIKDTDNGDTFPSFIYDDPQRKSKFLNEYYEAKAQYIIKTLEKQLPNYNYILERNRKISGVELLEELASARYGLEIQNRYLSGVNNNIDRINLITRYRLHSIESKLKDALSQEVRP